MKCQNDLFFPACKLFLTSHVFALAAKRFCTAVSLRVLDGRIIQHAVFDELVVEVKDIEEPLLATLHHFVGNSDVARKGRVCDLV